MQFGLLPRLMGPLNLYEVPISKVEKLERLVSSYARKWLDLPKCLSTNGLYSKGVLDLPISSLSEEYKCTKVSLEIMLLDLGDPFVAQAAPILVTRRKWTPSAATEQAKAALRHRDIVGQVQQGRSGARGTSARGGRQVHKSYLAGEARAVDNMGRSGEEEDLLARAMGNGGIQSKLHHQGCLRCPGISQEPQPVVWRRPHMLSWLQDQPHPRPLYLATQPGVKVYCSSAGNATDECERPSTPIIPLQTTFVRESEGQASLTTSRPDAGQVSGTRDWKLLVDLNQKMFASPQFLNVVFDYGNGYMFRCCGRKKNICK
ncbi:uncharacterized protein LOC127353767 [Dicentrarchus labrax]|uniref:uncharacterized protein LOC127353767 n=1 Tax=Dicentrarchus labrax TaxID=13489 RepID=UPI0021F682A8|nr:uncharacterized protein LOC127353767 [Dicentrarchus labrax]XP_051239276.1 uncharacterized protein LOC127353767 [Dicentrarchus labrax]XP_051239277.1 uncharacterized protein LOC127353767 [Dicentrarchus labrax]XP_051239278.1 uncharacterized protein LOC127353767 [Dicentrarchus labrax]XP_051239279.1 uncharacterized protein LOC127353767 [Dicentrarchus labrax]XP_051239280.1 uncharacterized protein LOC127353767 [Dicentrarchus labrax]XP_051239281.1 uncharacterized protein LOC127353767 [Dicentrarchu